MFRCVGWDFKSTMFKSKWFVFFVFVNVLICWSAFASYTGYRMHLIRIFLHLLEIPVECELPAHEQCKVKVCGVPYQICRNPGDHCCRKWDTSNLIRCEYVYVYVHIFVISICLIMVKTNPFLQKQDPEIRSWHLEICFGQVARDPNSFWSRSTKHLKPKALKAKGGRIPLDLPIFFLLFPSLSYPFVRVKPLGRENGGRKTSRVNKPLLEW